MVGIVANVAVLALLAKRDKPTAMNTLIAPGTRVIVGRATEGEDEKASPLNVQMTSPGQRAMSLRTSIKLSRPAYGERKGGDAAWWLFETRHRAVDSLVRLEHFDELGDGEKALDLVGDAGEP